MNAISSSSVAPFLTRSMTVSAYAHGKYVLNKDGLAPKTCPVSGFTNLGGGISLDSVDVAQIWVANAVADDFKYSFNRVYRATVVNRF